MFTILFEEMIYTKLLVSIIIPVYNAEKYLNECLNSILKQSYINYEVVMINDGSRDKSKQICEKFCRINSRFKLISQKNSGVSKARNVGIRNSTGEIIMFVDSDDFLKKDSVQTIVENIRNYDLLCFGYSEFYKDRKKAILYDGNLDDKNIFKKNVFMSKAIGGYLCNKAFKKSIIIKNNLLLDEKLHYCEDLVFVVEYLKYCEKVHYLNKPLYMYRMRKSSVSYNFFNKKNVTLLNSYKKLINYTDDIDVFNRLKYNYLVSYYKLKKFVPKNFFVDEDIINNEKSILKNANLSIKELLTFYLIKHFNLLYRFLRNEKNKKLNLFD